MPILRRAALAAPALLTLAQAMPADAQTPAPASQQAPGFYRFKVGGWMITTVHDGFFRRPLEGFVRNASIEEVRAVAAESFLPPDQLTITFTLTFAQKGDVLAVFDTGNGVTAAGATNGRAIANMAAAGIDPTKVTHVIFSHFHGDHVNGLLNAEGGRAFPNAEIIVPTPEWAWWTDTTNETRSPEGQRGQFANVPRRFAPYQGRVRQIAADAEVLPGITALPAPGHTPGHTIYRVSDGADQLVFLADITNRPEIMTRRPEWQIVFDFDGNQAAATRRRVLDMVATDRIRVTGYHFPFPANGYVARQGQGFVFVPAEWSSAV
ncbi:MBL fold metallo-hydrolase [Rhodovarius crocodyli]|uniref:MBL fold metallo-hydrolase n=1 Tax=Rhodovarius crocodyli TaxID=1979269 RepID=A0A437MEE4_9PROT|nr:MBL fold metallo-hydrolase [Rhodovarius crocodyli]RVT95969.1 MBL fold metallo-hydrolase [Rhodovarius crocodyli]